MNLILVYHEKDGMINDLSLRLNIVAAIPEKQSYIASTFTFFVVDHIFLVSRSEPYSFLEKALMPFDSEIWYWLIGFLAFGVLVIVVVSFMSQKVQNFVFGLKVRAPMLNLV
jgi:ABC-type methionine transport system permease subunit